LLDLMMPDMNGWQFREAQQRDARIKDIPLVVITASRDLVNHPIDADGVLLKPFGLNDLLGQVFKLVGHA
jgi:CheY-like chemotaxis protein